MVYCRATQQIGDTMKHIKLCLFTLLFFFTCQTFAANVGEWEYKTITDNLKPTPGCKDKDVAIKQASTGYRYKKYANLICKNIAYGWNLGEVLDKGEVVCDACEGEFEGKEKYRCYVRDITVKCRIVYRGW